jgi:hypothetical protein
LIFKEVAVEDQDTEAEKQVMEFNPKRRRKKHEVCNYDDRKVGLTWIVLFISFFKKAVLIFYFNFFSKTQEVSFIFYFLSF